MPAAADVVRAPVPRLWRSASDRVLGGVVGGIAEKLGWESKPLRILTALLGVLTLPLGALPIVVPYLWLWRMTSKRGVPRPAQPLRRSETHRVVAGVLGGIAERFGVSPIVARVAYSALTVATFGLPGIATYLVLWAKTPTGDDD